jgi:beta-lactamase class A
MKWYRQFIPTLIILLGLLSYGGGYDYPSLRDSLEPGLQSALKASLKQHMTAEFLEAIEQKRAAIVLADITEPFLPEVSAINPDEMMYAASLPKIAILLGVFVQIERGGIDLSAATREKCVQMIRHSSNRAASDLLSLVGPVKLAGILQSERFRLYDPDHNGGLWVGRDYSDGPLWKRDPLNGISHGATAMQVARFYYLLFTGRLVSPELTAEMKKILSDPAINHKFVKGLDDDRQQVDVYRKSGTWKNWHSDSGVIEHEDVTYIIVALSRLPQGGERLSRLAAAVDDLMKKRHTE